MRVRLSLILSLALPFVLAAQQVAPDGAARTVDSLLTAAAERGFGGVARVAKDGAVILHKAYGIAQRETSTPYRVNTVVQIGSNTKDFTAVAVLQLVHQGRLSLEDSLGRFFPNAPADKRGITVWQLLLHRGGFPLGLGPDSQRVDRAEFLRRAMEQPLQFAPGRSEQYSNLGYSLLATIIEQLSGTSYDVHVRDHIFAPLGMQHTGYLLPKFEPQRLAHGYTATRDIGTVLDLPHLPDGPSYTLRGNGGMLSTVADMATFYTALFTTETLLPAEVRNRMYDPRGGNILAGSDLTSYFMYQRESDIGLEIFLSSSTAAVKAPQLLRQVASAMGFRGDDYGPDREVVMNAPAIDLPDTPAGRMARAYLEMLNGGDSAAVVRFFGERMVAGPQSPSLEQRYRRLLDMRATLGTLTPVGFTVQDDGRVELRARSSEGMLAVLRFEIEEQAPHRMRALQVRVGG